MAFRLKRGEAVESGMRRIIGEELRSAMKNLTKAPAGRDAGIHEARKSFKKIRAMLRLLTPMMGGEAVSQGRRLQAAGRSLSGFRDAAVALETLDRLASQSEGAKLDKAVAAFRRYLAKEKEAAEAAGLEAAMSVAAAGVRRARGRVGHWQIHAGDGAGMRTGFERIWRRARRAYGAAQGKMATPAGHALRIRLKDVLYIVRLLEGSWLRGGKLAKRLKELETLLGDDHNLAVLKEVLVSTKATRGSISQAIAAERERLCSEAEVLSAEMFAEKPGEVARRIWMVPGAGEA